MIDLIPPFGVLIDPDRHTGAGTHELAIPFVVNLDLVRLPAQHVGPDFPGMLLADGHPLLAGRGIRQHARQAGPAIMRASAHEAQAIRVVVKVIVLLAVREQLPRKHQMRQFPSTRRRLRVLAFDPVQIAIKDARVTLVAQQDQGVRDGLEEALDGRGDRLAGLRVVVHHHGHGTVGACCHETAVEHLAQIRRLRGGQLREIVQQRRVVQRELVLHLVEVLEHFADVAAPELADQEQIALAELAIQVGDELIRKTFAEVLARVEPEALELELRHHPLAPVDHVGLDFRVRVVDVGEHEEVGVAGLVAHARRPVLVVAQDAEDGGAVVGGVVVGAGEVFPVILLRRVFVAATGEVEAQPGRDLKGFTDVFGAVIGVDFYDAAFLLLVRAGFVVENGVKVQTYAEILSVTSEGVEVFARAPFRRLAALLVELAHIVEIVNVVAVGFGAASAFACGRQPDIVDANALEVLQDILQPDVVLLVCWDVPFKALKEAEVLRGSAHGCLWEGKLEITIQVKSSLALNSSIKKVFAEEN